MLKRSHYIAFTAVVLLVVIILALPPDDVQLKIAISSLFRFFCLANWAHQLAERAGNSLRRGGFCSTRLNNSAVRTSG